MSNIASKKRVSLVHASETRLNSEIVLVVCPREELLTPERWQDIEALYHAARERGPGALAEAEPELKREVEALLAQDTEGLLDRPAADLLDDAGIAMLGAHRMDRTILKNSRLGSSSRGRSYEISEMRTMLRKP